MEKTFQTRAYASYSLKNKIREESSSGGIFSLVAEQVLSLNGLVYGAAYDDSFKVQHIAVSTNEGLSMLRGAKYAQSQIGDTFKAIQIQLDLGKPVLFSGTPCQVAGLKSFLKRDYDNLICVDFVCHGVPLTSVWEAYVKYRAQQDNNGNIPKKINLRSKHTGWSRYKYSNLYEYQDGTNYSALSGEDLFMRLFTGDYINQKSCSNCQFKGYSRVSDITLGDFWGIWDIVPEMDDNKGTSLVMVQSDKGATIWEKIQPEVKSKEMTLEEASRWNPSILHSSPAKSNRDEVIKLCLEGNWDEVKKVFPEPKKQSSFASLKYIMKHAVKVICKKEN